MNDISDIFVLSVNDALRGERQGILKLSGGNFQKKWMLYPENWYWPSSYLLVLLCCSSCSLLLSFWSWRFFCHVLSGLSCSSSMSVSVTCCFFLAGLPLGLDEGTNDEELLLVSDEQLSASIEVCFLALLRDDKPAVMQDDDEDEELGEWEPAELGWLRARLEFNDWECPLTLGTLCNQRSKVAWIVIQCCGRFFS